MSKNTGNDDRLSRADFQVLGEIDRILAWERDIEQQYQLPFRMPHDVKTSLQQCVHCEKDIALLIFGDRAVDRAGLEAYGRLMNEVIHQTNLPAYILALPQNTVSPDEPSLLLKVWPKQEDPYLITPTQWEQLIRELSYLHCITKK
jgi:hypothetical protein